MIRTYFSSILRGLRLSEESQVERGEVPQPTGAQHELACLQDTCLSMASDLRLHLDQLGQYRLLADRIADIVLFVQTVTGKILDSNSAACAAYGFSESELLSKSVYDLLSDDTCLEYGNRILSGNDHDVHFEGHHVRRDGTVFPVEMSAKQSETGNDMVIWVIRDITERRTTENAVAAALAAAKAANGRTQRIARVGDSSVNLMTNERQWSDEVFRLLGLDPADGIPKDSPPYKAFFSKSDLDHMDSVALMAISSGESHGGDYQVLRRDGTRLWVHQEIVAEYDADGTAVRLLGTLHDITDRKHTEHLLEEQARVDGLTGLPNRKAAADVLATCLATAQRAKSTAALLFIDIDRFKSINDSLGHSAGDDLLREVSARLRKCLRASDFAARMGGDEFVAILNEAKDPGRVAVVAETIKAALAQPFSLGRDVAITASIGIALFPQDGTTVEELITNADTAMYQAKREGRATHRFFSAEIHAAAQKQSRLAAAFKAAISRDEFTLAYHPIVSRAGKIIAAEALVRWPQADGSIMPPSEFIPYAEESGLIVPLGTWIMRTACERNAQWNAATNSALRVNVNVSAKQIADPSFSAMVLEALAASDLSPELLEIELTETALPLGYQQTVQAVRSLRNKGIRVALDDFGTGYNSFANLHSLHVDTLKLEKCFVDDIVDNAVDQAIASAIVSTASSLGGTSVAEGVENPEQGMILQELGFDEQQGYHYALPMSGDALQSLLAKNNAAAA
ncbi:MAG: EAL domain-containing protein [Candidatus Baltobacteraceae bacterium]